MPGKPIQGIQPSIIRNNGRVIRMLADQTLVMERGEIVMRGRGADMEAEGVRQKMSI